ncbi:MAG: FtsQ-type POTRA domain-containing protein [Phycicoccus sp.]|nr:FtsQ-type POTRA domain-containing protein [Phycicoccus sp.]NMM34650.1 FtsQ-type POTRA domain-containing protein [Phycicoccus sp.]
MTAWVAGGFALIAGVIWLVQFSPVLVARSVRVEGVPRGAVAQIMRRAAVPIGTPMVRVDTTAIADRVIATATLAEVSVGLSWPSTIVIMASPRVPVLAVKNPQGQVQVVDAEGVAYATVGAPPKGVPLIDTVENPPSRDALRAGIAVLHALSPSQRGRVTNVTVSGANMVTLKLGTVTVVWGGASEPELKVRVLTALLGHKGFRTIDVSAPRTPVTR